MSTQDDHREQSTPPAQTGDPVTPEETASAPTEQIAIAGQESRDGQESGNGQESRDGETEELPAAVTSEDPLTATREVPLTATSEDPLTATSEDPLTATQAFPTDAAPSPSDWRTAEYAGHGQAAGARTPTPTSTPGGAPTAPTSPTVSPTGSTAWTTRTGPDADALGGSGDMLSAHSPWSPTDQPPEAPARGVRVGLLIWAGVVLLLGVFLIALTLLPTLDASTALIGLVALLGVGLIVAAMGMSRRPRGREPQV